MPGGYAGDHRPAHVVGFAPCRPDVAAQAQRTLAAAEVRARAAAPDDETAARRLPVEREAPSGQQRPRRRSGNARRRTLALAAAARAPTLFQPCLRTVAVHRAGCSLPAVRRRGCSRSAPRGRGCRDRPQRVGVGLTPSRGARAVRRSRACAARRRAPRSGRRSAPRRCGRSGQAARAEAGRGCRDAARAPADGAPRAFHLLRLSRDAHQRRHLWQAALDAASGDAAATAERLRHAARDTFRSALSATGTTPGCTMTLREARGDGSATPRCSLARPPNSTPGQRHRRRLGPRPTRPSWTERGT